MIRQLSAHRSVAVLYSGEGGGSTCPTSTHTETEHHFNSSRGHAMKIPHSDPAWTWGETIPTHSRSGTNTTTPSPALASLFSHSKSILGN
ncbi:Hypothetical protein FKW44_016862 [Caligus rogercresseyi]|uniref:Uncharacterized protein n=1 Tax=Caligus rogercresseyi TaxID=217165 RepID=A0A7T8H2J8_CALRO|nr:Hypothetical protein FKW44_016862 [Caligus rogercresseyi]